MKALILNNKVVQLEEAEDVFPVSADLTWVDAPDGCITGWIVDEDGVFSPPLAEPEKPYDVQRFRDYPRIGDQLDDLFRKGAFSDEMATTLQAVKTKWPKDNSGPIE